MVTYLAKRVRYSLLVLLGVVTVVFFLFNVLPADPVRLTIGQRTDFKTTQNIQKELGLDKPMWRRYLQYIDDLSPVAIHNASDVAQTKYNYISLFRTSKCTVLTLQWPYLGRSYRTRREVSTVLGEALPGTMLLAIAAMLLATVAGIILGITAALNKGKIADTIALTASVAGISMPSFFAGLLIAYLFGYLLHNITGLNMTGSLWEYDAFSGRHLAIHNIVLPALALGIRPLAIITQLTRSALLDVLQQDYIRTAYAKGLPKYKVVLRHALPNALNPVVTSVTGWLAELLAGAFFVEYIFGWKGIGKITVDALDKFDFPLVMGAVLLTAFIFIVINLLTDLLYSLLDPRVRLY
jgi:peptide/nickel transport system permease protein